MASNALYDSSSYKGRRMLDDDKAALLPHSIQFCSRDAANTSKTKKIVLGVVAVLILGLAFAGGAVTQWRTRLLPDAKDKEQEVVNRNFTRVEPIKLVKSIPVATNGTIDRIDTGNDSFAGGFNLAGVVSNQIPSLQDMVKGLGQINWQPGLPVIKGCQYQYQFQFTKPIPKGNLLGPGTRVEREDVTQRMVGDCGFMASVLALIGNDQQVDLRQMLQLSGGTLTAIFRDPKSSGNVGSIAVQSIRLTRVFLDDTLPIRISGDPASCPEYGGAQRGPGSNGVLYVPLLEKAWAKYYDANPQLRSLDALGYSGIFGTAASIAISAFTGQQPRVISRTNPGLDAPILGQLAECVLSFLPCVIGTASLDVLRQKQPLGRVVNDKIVVDDTLTITIDATQDFITFVDPELGTTVVMVNFHYFAIDRENSFVGDGPDFITLINPHGFNKDAASAQVFHDASFKVSVSALSKVIMSVETANDQDRLREL